MRAPRRPTRSAPSPPPRPPFPAWARSGIQQRYEILKKASDEILARKEELGRLLAREEGKTLAEGIGEAARAGQIFAFFAGEALRLSGELVPSVRPGIEVAGQREPLGVVGLITPWNFPIAIPAWKIAPAHRLRQHGGLQAGRPGAGLRLGARRHPEPRRPAEGRAESRHGLGLGRRPGDPRQRGRQRHLLHRLGRDGQARRRWPRPSACASFQLEMGGKNPLVVLDDADLKTAVECAANGAFFSTGQRCTASSRLIVTEGIHDRFVGALVERIKALVVDDALKDGTHIGPVVDQQPAQQDVDYIDIGREEGARLAWGGERLNRATPGFYLQPALFTETKNDMRINREEIFGPVATVIRVKNYDEALATANDTPFGLSSGICTTSLKYATHFRKNSAGRHGDGQPADGGRRLSRALRRPQRLLLRPARAGPLRGGVLHDGEDDLHAAGLTRGGMENPAALIGIDWGTSAFRAARLDAAGTVLDRRSGPHGILSVERGDFAGTLSAMIGDWLEADKPPC